MPDSLRPAQFNNPLWQRWIILATFVVGVIISLPALARDYAFVIKSVETELHQNVYRLNARVEYRFSEEALNALTNGVPLLILMDFEVVKDRGWWLNKSMAELEQGYLLLYHALSEQFIIHNLNSGTQLNYSNLDNALDALGRVEHLPLIDANLLEPNGSYEVRMRTRLDIESLPAPMRPLAYISSDWQLDSNWVSWPLTR